MKVKTLLRFYFGSDKLDAVLERAMYRLAFSSDDAWETAERLADLIIKKEVLGELWRYLDGVMASLSPNDERVLAKYAESRVGLSALPPDDRRAVRRVVIKFDRHCRYLDRYPDALDIVLYYARLL